MAEPTVYLAGCGCCWMAACTDHGALSIWSDHTLATWDAIGHVSRHHAAAADRTPAS